MAGARLHQLVQKLYTASYLLLINLDSQTVEIKEKPRFLLLLQVELAARVDVVPEIVADQISEQLFRQIRIDDTLLHLPQEVTTVGHQQNADQLEQILILKMGPLDHGSHFTGEECLHLVQPVARGIEDVGGKRDAADPGEDIAIGREAQIRPQIPADVINIRIHQPPPSVELRTHQDATTPGQ